MARIEARLREMGLVLPQPLKVPAGLRMPFAWVKVRGNRAYVSGHIATNADGTIAEPIGKVGAEVTPEQGYELAKGVALAHLASRFICKSHRQDMPGVDLFMLYQVSDAVGDNACFATSWTG